MTYHIKSIPAQTTAHTIYTADGGVGYVKNDELHLLSSNAYYIYKFDNQRWYMRNDTAGTEHYLGVGASPTLNLENVKILDAEYWGEITYTPTENEE